MNVNLESLVSKAGLVRATEQSEAKVKRVFPLDKEEAVEIPSLFQVLTGASSSYCPRTSCENAVPGKDMTIKKRMR